MKKIEEDFLREVMNSTDHQSFEDIRNRINIERFEKKKTSSNRFSHNKMKVAGACMLLLAIAIPSGIMIWNSPDIVGSESGFNSGVNQLSESGQIASSVKVNSSTSSDGPDRNATVKTVINTYAPSLPHFLAAEVNKYVLLGSNDIEINVFIGHPEFTGDVAFSEFVLTLQELENYKFALMINYNNESLCIGIDDVDYLNSDYNITMTDKDGMEIINFQKMHELSLSTKNMMNKDDGFINVELYLMPKVSDDKYLVSSATLYYSVTETEIVFGLKQNPVAHEGDSGIIADGWKY